MPIWVRIGSDYLRDLQPLLPMGIPLPPPWVMLSIVLGFGQHLQDIKELGGLGLSIATGRGEDAGCKICDKLVRHHCKPPSPPPSPPPVASTACRTHARRR